MVPMMYAPSCVRPWTKGGDNGGSTSAGVTADTIKFVVVTWSPVSTGSEEQIRQEWLDWVALYQRHFRTWGRKVVVEFVDPPGNPTGDEAAQRAIGIEVGNRHPFSAYVSFGLPVTETELGARKIVTIEDGPPTHETAQKLAPYFYSSVLNGNEFVIGSTAEYIAKRLKDRPARWAGSAALQAQKRKFGLLYVDTADPKLLDAMFARHGVTLAEKIAVPLAPSDYQEQVRVAVARLKEAGVTSVINGTSFIYTAAVTKEATLQLYQPEWILTGSLGIDLTLFARTFDQDQWRHAFGPGQLPPTSPNGWRQTLWNWHYRGTKPHPSATGGVAGAATWLLFRGIHLAGPSLNPFTFQRAQFAEPPVGGAACNCVSLSQISFGQWGGAPGYDDYNGYDDFGDMWWDADTTGAEGVRGAIGPGMYRWMERGRRYMPGQWPAGEPPAFDRTNTITEEDVRDLPASDVPPDYPCDGCPDG